MEVFFLLSFCSLPLNKYIVGKKCFRIPQNLFFFRRLARNREMKRKKERELTRKR